MIRAGEWLYFSFFYGENTLNYMISFFDSNIWGFLAVPLGVVVCFGPALILWLKAEYGKQEDPGDDHSI